MFKSRARIRQYRGAGSIFPALFFAFLVLVTGCRTDEKFAAYSPHENVLSVASEFLLLAPQDPYREPIGQDLTGQSIARSTLVRLANYEDMHPGRLAPEVLAFKGRALELLGDYQSAARNFREAATYDSPVGVECERRAAILDRFVAALANTPRQADVSQYLDVLSRQAGEFRTLSQQFEDSFYAGLAMREAEQAEVLRAELIAANRYLLVDGEQQALQAIEQLVVNHRDSNRGLEHALRLARFHRELAEEEVRLHPPELGEFSLPRFKNHYDRAVDLLYRISQADGRPERLVAVHELDALLAYGEMIQKRAR